MATGEIPITDQEHSAPALSIHLTDACNLRCRYCYLPSGGRTTLDEDVAFDAVLSLLESSVAEVRIHYTGGEPLLCWDLMLDLTARIRNAADVHRRNVAFSVQTNGLLLTRDRVRRLLDVEDVSIGLSIDGEAHTHDIYRRSGDGRSSFPADAIESLSDVQRGRVPVTLVVSPGTASSLLASVVFLVAQGFRWIIPKLDLLEAWTAAELAMATAAYRDLGAWYAETVHLDDAPVLRPLLDRAAARLHGWTHDCGAGVDMWALAPSGTVFPCSLQWALALRQRKSCQPQPPTEVPRNACSIAGCPVVRCGVSCPAFAALAPKKHSLICWFERLLAEVSAPLAPAAAAAHTSPVLTALRDAPPNFCRCHWV